ncbi:MAG: hypothetical protein PSU93_09400 [Methylobacter sp.]|uniref:Uncharacterized protein n=1 Tax=Candidatus Methylobacter titanis TaxID=3053457 RepID=A0AA43Q4E6_9GAMM|nr:hypothetical protein [Candidatus Methylobacter titanis]
MNTKTLKARIRFLHALTQVRTSQLAVRLYYAGLKPRTPVIVALQDELDAIKREGREAVFDLLISLSHRQFMNFIRELEHA